MENYMPKKHAQKDSDSEFLLIETLLWRPDQGYWFLADHLERLAASAKYFDFSCNCDRLEKQLVAYSSQFSEVLRVRLTLARNGAASMTSQPCALPRNSRLPDRPESASGQLPWVMLADAATDESECWRIHKTTHREIYDQGFALAREKGYFDQIYVNKKGEITEGSIANVVIYREDVYLTPPVSCGLLPGVMRKQLMADPAVKIKEQILYPADIRAAEALFLVNSVRGVVRVQIDM